MQIDFNDEAGHINEAEKTLLSDLLQFAAKQESIAEEAELSVTFVTNAEIQEINRDYRGKDMPTDVISFALEETGEGEIEIIEEDLGMPRVLGDIIISVERTSEQASEYGHSFERELGFLAVHGFLHLLGYDHMNEADERKMFSRQEEVLGMFGLER